MGRLSLDGLYTRDMIALVAMHGIVTGDYSGKTLPVIAEAAYEIADLMIQEGQKRSR